MHIGNRSSRLLNGRTAALISASVGLAGAVWWFGRRLKKPPAQRSIRSALANQGQAPSRGHIQLFAHPARQEPQTRTPIAASR
jgi:hypothetical protein